jgi:hypothetical protein
VAVDLGVCFCWLVGDRFFELVFRWCDCSFARGGVNATGKIEEAHGKKREQKRVVSFHGCTSLEQLLL